MPLIQEKGSYPGDLFSVFLYLDADPQKNSGVPDALSRFKGFDYLEATQEDREVASGLSRIRRVSIAFRFARPKSFLLIEETQDNYFEQFKKLGWQVDGSIQEYEWDRWETEIEKAMHAFLYHGIRPTKNLFSKVRAHGFSIMLTKSNEKPPAAEDEIQWIKNVGDEIAQNLKMSLQ